MRDELEGYLLRCRDSVFLHIRAYLEKRTAVLPRSMKKCVVDYPYRRGKALRPALMMLFSGAYGGAGPEAVKVAAAYQLLEDLGLGRDDILDGGTLRRGRPALHLLYGMPKAVNALDMLHDCVYDMLYSYCGLSPRRYREVRAVFSEATAVTLGGQHLDIEAREIPLEKFTGRAYLRIAERKTAFYTAVAPCLLGADLAGAGGKAGAIREFGRPLGTAFQLVDDVLDAENDGAAGVGKTPGSDILEGKRTLLAAAAFRRLAGPGKRRLAAFYSLLPEKRTPERAAEIRREILASGAPAECREKAGELTAEALRVFEKRIYPSMKGPCRDMIRELALKLRDRRF